MNSKKIALTLIIPLSLSACTSKPIQAKIENRQDIVFTKQGQMEVVRIYQNDTLESIAQQKSVPIEVLAAANNLSYPYYLYNLRTLMIPQEKYHKVQRKNETLKSISRQYDVDLMQLMDMNNMSHIAQNKQLKVGILIKIPQQNYTQQHIKDDNFNYQYTKNKDYDVIELDEIKDDVVHEQPLDDEFIKPEIEFSDKNETYTSNDNTTIEFENALKDTLKKEPSQLKIENSHTDSFKTLTPLNSQLFIWPLNGIISRDNKDGITIFAPLNSSIKAAASGKIIFAENDNDEYGNLIIIKHSDGYLSAYAHNNQILVKKGDQVQKGQTISKVGKSGKVTKPQLYFSIRRGKEIIHPESEIN